jgi:carbon storage regulator
MLVLTLKPGASVFVGDNVRVTIVRLKDGSAVVGFEGPREVDFIRSELLPLRERVAREAAAGVPESE